MLQWLANNLALIMFGSMFFVIFCGYPVAFVMGGLAFIFALIGWCLDIFPIIGLSNIVLRMWGGVAVDPILVSIPMFIFMGSILERSGSAKDMLLATEVMLRRVPGALAVAVMVMGTILAAPMGPPHPAPSRCITPAAIGQRIAHRYRNRSPHSLGTPIDACGFQSPIACQCETTRAPGLSSRSSFGRSRRLSSFER